jgi:hypothetical protein
MFRTAPLSIIRSSFTVHSAMVYHCWVYREWISDDGKVRCPTREDFHAKNKFAKLVHLVGLTIKKYVVHLSVFIWYCDISAGIWTRYKSIYVFLCMSRHVHVSSAMWFSAQFAICLRVSCVLLNGSFSPTTVVLNNCYQRGFIMPRLSIKRLCMIFPFLWGVLHSYTA